MRLDITMDVDMDTEDDLAALFGLEDVVTNDNGVCDELLHPQQTMGGRGKGLAGLATIPLPVSAPTAHADSDTAPNAGVDASVNPESDTADTGETLAWCLSVLCDKADISPKPRRLHPTVGEHGKVVPIVNVAFALPLFASSAKDHKQLEGAGDMVYYRPACAMGCGHARDVEEFLLQRNNSARQRYEGVDMWSAPAFGPLWMMFAHVKGCKGCIRTLLRRKGSASSNKPFLDIEPSALTVNGFIRFLRVWSVAKERFHASCMENGELTSEIHRVAKLLAVLDVLRSVCRAPSPELVDALQPYSVLCMAYRLWLPGPKWFNSKRTFKFGPLVGQGPIPYEWAEGNTDTVLPVLHEAHPAILREVVILTHGLCLSVFPLGPARLVGFRPFRSELLFAGKTNTVYGSQRLCDIPCVVGVPEEKGASWDIGWKHAHQTFRTGERYVDEGLDMFKTYFGLPAHQRSRMAVLEDIGTWKDLPGALVRPEILGLCTFQSVAIPLITGGLRIASYASEIMHRMDTDNRNRIHEECAAGDLSRVPLLSELVNNVCGLVSTRGKTIEDMVDGLFQRVETACDSRVLKALLQTSEMLPLELTRLQATGRLTLLPSFTKPLESIGVNWRGCFNEYSGKVVFALKTAQMFNKNLDVRRKMSKSPWVTRLVRGLWASVQRDIRHLSMRQRWTTAATMSVLWTFPNVESGVEWRNTFSYALGMPRDNNTVVVAECLATMAYNAMALPSNFTRHPPRVGDWNITQRALDNMWSNIDHIRRVFHTAGIDTTTMGTILNMAEFMNMSKLHKTVSDRTLFFATSGSSTAFRVEAASATTHKLVEAVRVLTTELWDVVKPVRAEDVAMEDSEDESKGENEGGVTTPPPYKIIVQTNKELEEAEANMRQTLQSVFEDIRAELVRYVVGFDLRRGVFVAMDMIRNRIPGLPEEPPMDPQHLYQLFNGMGERDMPRGALGNILLWTLAMRDWQCMHRDRNGTLKLVHFKPGSYLWRLGRQSSVRSQAIMAVHVFHRLVKRQFASEQHLKALCKRKKKDPERAEQDAKSHLAQLQADMKGALGFFTSALDRTQSRTKAKDVRLEPMLAGIHILYRIQPWLKDPYCASNAKTKSNRFGNLITRTHNHKDFVEVDVVGGGAGAGAGAGAGVTETKANPPELPEPPEPDAAKKRSRPQERSPEGKESPETPPPAKRPRKKVPTSRKKWVDHIYGSVLKKYSLENCSRMRSSAIAYKILSFL